MSPPNDKDLTGMRFGRLIAQYPTERRKNRSVIWHCLCDCGKSAEATARDLGRGAVKSCGCLKHRPPAPDYQIKNNLHFVNGTCIENLIASQRRSIKSSTGVRGVYRAPDRKSFVATIGFQGKSHYLGKFDSLQEAAMERTKAEQELFKTFLDQYFSELKTTSSENEQKNPSK